MEWKTRIRELEREFREEFQGFSGTDLNYRPNPQTWSIGQVLEHIQKLNESYYPIFDRLQKGELELPFPAWIPFIPQMIGRQLLKAVDPANRKKSRTLPLWEPASSNLGEDLLPRFLDHHRVLMNELDAIRDHINGQTIIHSPAGRWIVYPLDMAIEIMLRHEQRHFFQAREVGAVVRGIA